MIEELLANGSILLILPALPAYFLLFWANDMIKLKLALVRGKKKGTKFVIGISADKTVRISAETPYDKSSFVFKNDKGQSQEVSITPDDLLFAPQFGTQAAIVTQGSKSIFNPFKRDMYDPIDGDYIAVAIAKAKQLGMFGDAWGSTKEQKLLIIILILTIGAALISFSGISQVGEVATQISSHHSAVMTAVSAIPVGL